MGGKTLAVQIFFRFLKEHNIFACYKNCFREGINYRAVNRREIYDYFRLTPPEDFIINAFSWMAYDLYLPKYKVGGYYYRRDWFSFDGEWRDICRTKGICRCHG